MKRSDPDFWTWQTKERKPRTKMFESIFPPIKLFPTASNFLVEGRASNLLGVES